MVLGVGAGQLAGRFGMWWFDARQQFGVDRAPPRGRRRGPALDDFAAVGDGLVVLAYAFNTVFAFTYNVGDTHVFYLPGHLFTAFLRRRGDLSHWRGP